MRLFFCVELPDAVRATLARSARPLQTRIRGGTWVSEENLHITLRFLGEVGEDLLPPLRDLGQTVTSGLDAFDLPLDRLGAFPSPTRARVLWVGATANSAPFATLAQRIEEEVQALGFPPERKPVHPHVTLARLRIPQDLASLIGGTTLPDLRTRVDGLTLMQSELRPHGPLYTPVARWKLGG
jgi:2'-5' RNA ligase